MNVLEYTLGEICKILFPISDRLYFGNPNSSVAICTLSSMSLLKDIAQSHLLSEVAVAGRLLSENRGIDTLVKFVTHNSHIKTIILCGKEVYGHKTGHSLLCLHKYGLDVNKRIINSQSPDPTLTISLREVKQFQRQVKLIDLIGETRIQKIRDVILPLL